MINCKMKKFIAVIMTVCLILTASVCLVSAYTAKEDTSTTLSSSTVASSSAIGSVLRAFLGDAADNLSNQELADIATKLFGDFDLSTLFGNNSESIIDEILDYIGNVETTTESVPATRPPEVTEEAAAETTTKPKETEKTTEEEKKTTASTTAQAVQNYYYYYVVPTTEESTTSETTTVTYEYIPPETIYTDLLTTATYVGEEDQVDTSDGFGIKTVIGIIILIGSGAAVVFLCVRKRASY